MVQSTAGLSEICPFITLHYGMLIFKLTEFLFKFKFNLSKMAKIYRFLIMIRHTVGRPLYQDKSFIMTLLHTGDPFIRTYPTPVWINLRCIDSARLIGICRNDPYKDAVSSGRFYILDRAGESFPRVS